MEPEVERKIISILKILNKCTAPMGASLISRQLVKDYGITLSDRAIRYHLKIMDERGLTNCFGKNGREITEKGKEELKNALVSDKVGMVITKIQEASYRTDLNIKKATGKVVLNISLIEASELKQAIKAMKPVFESELGISRYLVIAKGGESIGEIAIPQGKAAIGTICSVTINGVLVKAGIPVDSLFAGILQIDDNEPRRFTELIKYEGTSLDPLEIFIRSKMTNVTDVAKKGRGKILASFREISAVSLGQTIEIVDSLKRIGISGILRIGEPSQPVAGVPVGMDKVGIVIAGGLNPLAAVEEAGIETHSKAMSTLIDFTELHDYRDLL